MYLWISLYRSHNQFQDDFESFMNNLELGLDLIIVDNSFLIVVLGDFDANSNLC